MSRPRALRILALSSYLAIVGAACGGEPLMPAPHPTRTVKAGDYAVRVEHGSLDIALLRGDTVLLHFPADGIELGVVPTVDDAANYDPYWIMVANPLSPPPDGLAWLRVEQALVTDASDSAVTLALSFAGQKRATLRIEAGKAGSFKATLRPDATSDGVAYIRLRPRVDKDEGFYGLGEYLDAVNHRGKVRAMQLELDPGGVESSYNEAHVPVPFIVGTKGWGMFVESPRPGAFDVASNEPDLVDAIFGTGVASGEGLVFHLFGDDKPIDVTRHYYDVTAYPRLPARWALGPWVWRNENKDQAQVVSDLTAMRDLDLATTAYWLDRPYASGVNTFDFNPVQFPDPHGMIGTLHALGFRTAVWHAPYLDQKDDKTAALRAEAKAKGFYPSTTGLLLNHWGPPIDLTNRDAYEWWQGHVKAYTDVGVEGFKLDYGEDIVIGLTGGRNVWGFHDGSDERTMHARYQLFYHRLYADTLPDTGGFLLCRHGMYGDQAHVSVIWPGDLDASFAKHGEPAKDGSSKYVSVGGLPASVIAGLSLGPSGFPFFGADTGGYRHQAPDKELFTRWFEQTALSTVMQIGNAASTVAWEADPTTGFDAEMLGWYRTYTRLHLRLFPYEWTYAQNLGKDGRAIARPLGLAYPELGQHPDDIYMFGDSLLVAPVLTRGAVSRTVILPAGRWIDWWDGKAYAGGQTLTVAAPLGKLPLFLREGGIVPMLRPTIDTTAPTAFPEKVDSYATTPGVLYVRVVPGEVERFTVFDGAELGAVRTGAVITLTSRDGTEFRSGVLFEIVASGGKPTVVADGGAPLVEKASLAALEASSSGWAFTADTGGTLFVKVGAGKHKVQVLGVPLPGPG